MGINQRAEAMAKTIVSALWFACYSISLGI